MGLLENLQGLIQQAASCNASTADTHTAYDQVVQAVPQGSLSDAISHTFKSDQTPAFDQMVAGLFSQTSNPIRNQALRCSDRLVRRPRRRSHRRRHGGAHQPAQGGSGVVTPQQAEQVSPQAVEVLAQNAARKDPSIMDKAAGFYAQHPDLVKGIGVAALGS